MVVPLLFLVRCFFFFIFVFASYALARILVIRAVVWHRGQRPNVALASASG